MEEYISAESVGGLRKPYESDDQWDVRRAFIERNLDSFPKNRLLCLSNIFVNVNYLGCVYQQGLMEKVQRMGAGIFDDIQKAPKQKANENDRGGAVAETQRSPNIKPSDAKKRKESLEDQKKKSFVLMKANLSMSEKSADSLQRLNQTTSRLKLQWELKEENGKLSVVVDEVIVLTESFPAGKTLETKQFAAAATIAAVLSENVEVRNVVGRYELWRGEVGPTECYTDYVCSVVRKAAKLISPKGTSFSRLEMAFASAGVPLHYEAVHGTGWEQRISLRILNVELASAELRKGECTKGKENERKEELSASVISVMQSDKITFAGTEGGLVLQR